MHQGQLDHKAQAIWAPTPGVEYVLCIRTDENFTNAEYKLYDVATNGPPATFNTPIPMPPVVIGQGPAATITFDTRRVLGITIGQPLPADCPNQYDVNLHGVLVVARASI